MFFQSKGLSRVFSNTTVQKHQFFSTQPSLLEEGMATHSSILAWRIPWTEEPARLQSMGSQRVGHDWVTRGRPRMRRLDGITNSMDMSLIELRELLMYRLAWCAVIHVITKNQTWLGDWTELNWCYFSLAKNDFPLLPVTLVSLPHSLPFSSICPSYLLSQFQCSCSW